jgi:hypothetical protein
MNSYHAKAQILKQSIQLRSAYQGNINITELLQYMEAVAKATVQEALEEYQHRSIPADINLDKQSVEKIKNTLTDLLSF